MKPLEDTEMSKVYKNDYERMLFLEEKVKALIKLLIDVICEMKGESIESTVIWGITLEKELDKILEGGE